MSHRSRSYCRRCTLVVAAVAIAAAEAAAQFPPGGGRGGNRERAVVEEFDADKDGRLNADEREAARQAIGSIGGGRGGGGRGRRGGAARAAVSPGVRLTPAEVRQYPDAPLYDAATLRTFFLEFQNPDWEAELVAFNNTDVDVPATVTVDGRVYRDVGVHFRGNSSFNVGDGAKRSLNLSFDFVHEGQSIGGYRTLNFLNANTDPTFLRTVLSMHIARQYIPAPRTNFVRVVINGENWGVYANAQQFNKEFVNDNFGTTKGMRWKVPQGGGGGIGGFTYMGDDPARYRSVFQIKSKDEPEAWAAIIDLAKTLQETPPERLEEALASRVDLDGYLRFLALDNVLANGDGFYTRASDYSLYRDLDGRFHFVFHDANEMFNPGRAQLSPLAAQFDTNKPIIAKVLAVPALRARYLAFMREIAETSMDWSTLGPVAAQYRNLIAADVARDTRKLYTNDEFLRATADEAGEGTLRSIIEQRRAFVLDWIEENTP